MSDENLHGLIFGPLARPHQIFPIRRNHRQHIRARRKRNPCQPGSVASNHVNLVVRVIRPAVGKENMLPVGVPVRPPIDLNARGKLLFISQPNDIPRQSRTTSATKIWSRSFW